MPGSRARRIAYYATPMLFCVLVHWIAVRTWFWGDDFAWLGLPLEAHGFRDWLDVLFGPRAQGTVRTLSERVYFLVCTDLFGINAAPFRIWAFLTQFANLYLLSRIAQHITGSSVAGLLAPLLWCLNAGLAVAMAWSSAYNEICCSFFLLLAFWLLLRYFDTGRREYWIWQWVAFLLGFGALELIVMYPAIASLYAWLWQRRQLRRTVWLFVPSAAFTVAHFTLVPKSADPHYAMHFTAVVFVNLWHYWGFAVGAYRADVVDWRPLWLGLSFSVACLAAVAYLAIKQFRITAFCAGWFVLLLLPVLPLTNHFTEYYLTMPAIGLAVLGAFAIVEYPKAAVPLILLGAVLSVSDLRVTEFFNFERARRMKRVVTGLEEQRSIYEGKEVIMTGVDNDTFWSGFADDPFRLIGIPEIVLAPGTEKSIDAHPEWGGIQKFVTPLEPALQAIKQNRAVVFALSDDGRVHEITRRYQIIAASQFLAEHREKVDVGDPLYASRLGPGWYNAENGFRWMGKSASVQIGGPTEKGATLIVTGYCPAAVLAQGPVVLTVLAESHKLGAATLTHPDQKFELTFAVPDVLTGKYMINVAVEVNRTTRAGSDPRPLGLIFGTFRMK
ncbi:MAG: glycosyltransferase family 39 protein [Acidobacteriaceae bacterium]|nr:glycosyltransferase family 39 protein [Acidobacteriaceae bacterium]